MREFTLSVHRERPTDAKNAAQREIQILFLSHKRKPKSLCLVLWGSSSPKPFEQILIFFMKWHMVEPTHLLTSYDVGWVESLNLV